jgi:hypothetical protein
MNTSARSSKDEQLLAQDHHAVLPVSSLTVDTERPARLVTIGLQGSSFYPYPGPTLRSSRVYHYKISIIDGERLPDNTGRRREIENHNRPD